MLFFDIMLLELAFFNAQCPLLGKLRYVGGGHKVEGGNKDIAKIKEH